MKKKRSEWLFVLKGYVPEPDANGNCVSKLRGELAKKGVYTDVLRIRLSSTTPDVAEDDAGTVYSADTWMRFGRIGRFETSSKLKKLVRLPRAAVVRSWHYLTNGRFVDEKYYGPNACRGLKARLEQLCRENRYKWVIAVSVPFCTQETAASADLNGANLAFYSLDPYSRNFSYSKQNEDTRSAEEMKVMEKASVHFVSLEHRQDWLREPQNRFISKIKCIPYPNLMRREVSSSALPEGFFDKEKINCVYLGSLLDGIRVPLHMLELFAGISQIDQDIRLYVIGKRDGHEQNAQLEKYKSLMGDALQILEPVDFSTAEAIQAGADVLVNIGNLIPNQMPSKLLDYIAAGKPIICISELEPCNMEPYWSRYPLMFRADSQHAGSAETAAAAAEFCAENRGKRLEWETVRECFSGFVAEDVAQTFIDTLSELEK